MKRLITLTAILALSAGLAQAQTTTQTVTPGDNFMAQWDVDGDSKVTLAEAREHRGDIFSMFDSDDNGSYSEDELKGIDEHKLMQLEAGMGPGHNLPEGMEPGPKGKGPGNGMGRGPGQGQGQRMGQGAGMAGQGLNISAEDGMKMFDTNQDGTVTRAEFVDGTDAWFKMRDKNGDGVLTLDDFGPRR